MSEDDSRRGPERPDGSETEPAPGVVDQPSGAEERAPLPSWNRTRTKRREKKSEASEDAFTRGVKGAGVAAVRQGRIVALGVIVVIGVIAGGVFLYQQREESRADASKSLARVAALQARAFVGDAETLGLTDGMVPPSPVVADESARVAATQSALDELTASGAPEALVDLLAASNALRNGDASEALEHYQSFVRAVPADHALAFLAQEGTVLAKEASGDVDGALSLLAELLDPPGHFSEAGTFYRDVLLGHRGRLLEVQSQTDEATAVYRQIHSEFDLTDANPGVADEFVRGRLQALDPAVLAPEPAAPTAAPDEADAGAGSAGASPLTADEEAPAPSQEDPGKPGETADAAELPKEPPPTDGDREPTGD